MSRRRFRSRACREASPLLSTNGSSSSVITYKPHLAGHGPHAAGTGGNWKNNGNPQQVKALIEKPNNGSCDCESALTASPAAAISKNVEVVVAPPALFACESSMHSQSGVIDILNCKATVQEKLRGDVAVATQDTWAKA